MLFVLSLTHCSNKSRTFAFENRKNIAAIALSPDASVLLSVDEGEFSVLKALFNPDFCALQDLAPPFNFSSPSLRDI